MVVQKRLRRFVDRFDLEQCPRARSYCCGSNPRRVRYTCRRT
jgi:hypothetical protein